MSHVSNPLDDHPVYELVGDLGTNSKGFSQIARNKETGELVAIKFTPRGWDKNQSKYMIRELVNLQELSLSHHPHVVEFKDAFLTRHYLAQAGEYVEGSTLQAFLEKAGGRVIEAVARFLFQQLVLAVEFIHRKSKVNRDIKLSNILLSMPEGQLPLLKLCDFGFSKDTYRDSQACSQVGTALYVAPEVMQNFEEGPYDGRACDIWACGVVLAIMLYGRHPFLRLEDEGMNQSQQMIKLFQRVMGDNAEYPKEVRSTLSDSCMDLINRMLKVDPKERISMDEILQHPWFLEALPPGAATMNNMFVADTDSILSAEAIVEIEALVLQGSMTERHASSQAQQYPIPEQQAVVQRRLAQKKRYQHQRRIDQEIEQDQILEDMVMNMPTSELLHAATVDLREMPSNASPNPYVHVHTAHRTSPTRTNASSSGGGGASPPTNTVVTKPMCPPPPAQSPPHLLRHNHRHHHHHHHHHQQQQQQLQQQYSGPQGDQTEELDLQQLHLELQQYHHAQAQAAQVQESCLSDTSRHDVYPSPYRLMMHGDEEAEHSPLEDISSLGVNSEEWANFPGHDTLPGQKGTGTGCASNESFQHESYGSAVGKGAKKCSDAEDKVVLLPRSRARRKVVAGTLKRTA